MLLSPPEARYRQERVRELQRQKLILAAPAFFWSSELPLNPINPISPKPSTLNPNILGPLGFRVEVLGCPDLCLGPLS